MGQEHPHKQFFKKKLEIMHNAPKKRRFFILTQGNYSSNIQDYENVVKCGQSAPKLGFLDFAAVFLVHWQNLKESWHKLEEYLALLPKWTHSLTRPSSVSQRSLHNEPIFRLLLKVAVKGTQQCEFLNFCGVYSPILTLAPSDTQHGGWSASACW